MLSPLRNRFGIPGVISVIALVFAMLGGAYAASNGGGSQTAEASKRKHKKKSKAKRGPRGPRGKQGPVGPQGPAGAQGAKGDKGDAGSNGSNGSNGAAGATGAAGQSVTTTEILPFEPECNERGGVELHSASGDDLVCNGATGDEGSPWTAGGTLPAGATETGAWVGSQLFTEGLASAPISFAIPLAAGIEASHVHKTGDAGFATDCPGSYSNPTAASGHLCVYIGGFKDTEVIEVGGVERSGTYMFLSLEGPEAFIFGSWAVTA